MAIRQGKIAVGGNRSSEFEQRLKGVSCQQISKTGGGIRSTVRYPRSFHGCADFVKLAIEQMIPAAAGLANSVDAFCETIGFSRKKFGPSSKLQRKLG